MADLQTLAQRVSDVHERYQREFANRSRITRDLSRLDSIIATLEGVLLEAGADAAAQANLLPTVRTRLELYRNERKAIKSAKDGGPAEVTAHRVSEWTWLNTQRYRRNFAGQSRRTRDTGLLAEMRSEQLQWHQELSDAAKSMPAGWRTELLNKLKQEADLYAREAIAIQDLRGSLSESNIVGTYATLANGQFTLWREHFAQRPRSGRRLPLLSRMLSQLQSILASMQAIPSSHPQSSVNASNMSKVRSRIENWTTEQDQITRAIASAGPESVTGTLATDANNQFKAYREGFAGKSRTTVDLQLLGSICERLHEIARTMDTLDKTWAIERNAKNLEVVMENLKTYEREHNQVLDAQKNIN
jgi:hypothetical protein